MFAPFDFAHFAGDGILQTDEDEALSEYGRLLRASIETRIAGRTSVGMLLSGGLDSGGILAVLGEMGVRPVETFSIGFRDNPCSEHVVARNMAKTFGTTHREYLLDGSEIERMPCLVDAFEEPFSEAGIFINDAAMRLASGVSDVVLGGDGNDQMFGTGVREFALGYLARRYGMAPLFRLADACGRHAASESERLFKLRFRARTILGGCGSPPFGIEDHDLLRLAPGMTPLHDELERPNRLSGSFDDEYDAHVFDACIRCDQESVILRKAGTISTLHGVDLTFPYTDGDLYGFVPRLPRSLRTKGSVWDIARGHGSAKYLHKKLIAPLIPPEVFGRKKQGGFTPLAIFFADPDRRRAFSAYILRSAAARAMFDRTELAGLLDRCESDLARDGWFWRRHMRANQVLNLLAVALWWDIFIGGDRRERLSDYLYRSDRTTVSFAT